MGRTITEKIIEMFESRLIEEEKSENTVAKYLRDIRVFAKYAGGKEITKEKVIEYKRRLISAGYAARSVNSMLASINSLFSFLGWDDLKVKSEKIQRSVFCPEERELSEEEYKRLCRQAEREGDGQLSLILQTICSTGIRVSELRFITVNAVKIGTADVNCKGKRRTVILVKALRKKLLKYIGDNGISEGPVFTGKNGEPVSRVKIWRDMKRLCKTACVDPKKVFPHNLRHLFARVFYRINKDIAKLADILGHSSIDTTRIYIVSTGAEHRRRMERMCLIL